MAKIPAPTSTPNPGALRHLRAADLRPLAQLAVQSTAGIAALVEGVHQSVCSTLGRPGTPGRPGAEQTGQTRGITGLVYRSVQGVTQAVGKTLDVALAKLAPLFQLVDGKPADTPERVAVLAALNGVMGDRLAATSSPLATSMVFYARGRLLNLQKPLQKQLPVLVPNGKMVLVIHGLCMNDLQWQTAHQGQPVNHGQQLAAALNATPVYLRYNSGLHVSENGHELAALLAQLLQNWPQAVTELTVLVHSMGGLVVRSAVHSAAATGLRWPGVVKSIVFLGTPHHGAPLERAGNAVDVLLGSTRWSKPFGKLAQLRSSGITDLRYGFVVDADWLHSQGQARFRSKPDQRLPVPLPAHIACYAIAAAVASQRSQLADRLVGDGLVPLHSALGLHASPERTLHFPKAQQRILYRTNHMQLLSSPEVGQQLLTWLAPTAAT